MNQLRGAYAKLARADETLIEFKALCVEICAAQAKATVIQTKMVRLPGMTEPVQMLTVDNSAHEPVPDKCGAIAGEIATNLWSALNYLVGQLAILSAGSRGKRNQFPIESTPEAFKGNTSGTRGFLAGVSPAHAAAIERLQPYNGCDWTKALSKISNFDKHTDLVVISHDQLVSGAILTQPAANGKSVDFHVKMHIEPALRIGLGDGMPLVETLEVVKSEVSALLDAFKPEFK